MNKLQKAGGAAALVNAAAYIIGLSIAFTYLAPYLEVAPEQYLAFMMDNQALLYAWHLLIYLVAGVFMVPLVLGLHERLKDSAPALAQVTAVFGIIWTVTVIGSGLLLLHNQRVIVALYAQDPAQATTVWLALSAIADGLGGAIELPGGIWVLLLSLAGWQTGRLPKGLNVLGCLVGASGVVTAVPPLHDFGIAFGLGSIIWFIWVGIFLLRHTEPHLADQSKTLGSRPILTN
ncbi:MAG: DUF4386 domain-containing protein [Anaerolineaceae bacterium]|nr:DUF4386 domain-containing protein [Anaerolineaceae bacterium]